MGYTSYKGRKGIMKIAWHVKSSVIGLLGLLLVGCHEYQPPTSHFGTGQYYCFYHDTRTGQFYKGIADDKDDAIMLAKNKCRKTPPKDLNHRYCQFSDCVFR